MTISLKHAFQSAKTDGADTDQVQPSDWNAEHTLTMATGSILGRSTAGTGAVEEISVGSGLSLSAGTLTATGTGTGDVTGPASSTDGGLVRFNGTTGKVIKADSTGIVTAEIAASAVTYAKIQNVSATSRLLGRVTAGAGVVEELTPTAARTLLAIDGTQEWTIWASNWTPQATNGASRGIAYMATNLQPVETLDFDTTTQEFAAIHIKLPKRWNLGTLTFQPIWTAASGSGGVVWALEAVAISDGETLDAAYGTAQTSTDTLSTVNYLHVGPASSAITAAGTPAAGDVLCLRIKRVPADGSDTLAADAKLLGAIVTWTSSAGNDA